MRHGCRKKGKTEVDFLREVKHMGGRTRSEWATVGYINRKVTPDCTCSAYRHYIPLLL